MPISMKMHQRIKHDSMLNDWGEKMKIFCWLTATDIKISPCKNNTKIIKKV